MHTEEQVFDKVADIVSEQMGVDRAEINKETSFVNDLNADSLDTVELVMELEDEFDISFPLNDLANVRTLADLARELEMLTEKS